QPSAAKERVEMREPLLDVLQVPLARRRVVAPEVGDRLVVRDSVHSGWDWIARRDPAPALVEDALGVLPLPAPSGFTDGPAVDVDLRPPGPTAAVEARQSPSLSACLHPVLFRCEFTVIHQAFSSLGLFPL